MAVESTTLMSDAAKYIYDSTKASQASSTSSNTLTTDDYWKLMAAQLQYQDMTNPMDNSEMMNQMTQMSSMSTMEKLSEAVANFSTVTNNLSTVTLTSYSTGLLGKEVTVAVPDPNGEKDEDGKTKLTYTKGTVTGVDLTGATSVYVDGRKYELSQVMSVGDVPETTETKKS
jgi:flagellar basal-body rod modification protein FlgD